jgi:glycosyltransferase involved in cell wall biosynthesis
MKLAAFLQIYNEETKGNLRRCLDSLSLYCDVICIYDDASTDNSVEVAESYEKVRLIRGDKNEFNKEIHHKQKLLEFTKQFNPDWLFWMDADEIIEKRGEDGALRDLCRDTRFDSYDFRQVNFWRSERYYRVDGQFNSGIFRRLWRCKLQVEYSVADGLHRKPYPENTDPVKTSDLRILHYGFASTDNIVDKYRTYKQHGQSGWALDRLVDETRLTLAATDKEWLGREPEGFTGIEIEAQGPVRSML